MIRQLMFMTGVCVWVGAASVVTFALLFIIGSWVYRGIEQYQQATGRSKEYNTARRFDEPR